MKEPLFGLDSGMSTFRVDHIFKPKRWNNILLQDFDYHFERAKTSNAHLLRNSQIEYTLETRRPVWEYANGVYAEQKEDVDIILPVNLKFQETTKTTVTVRSRDGLDQRVKLLEHITQTYPLFKKYMVIVPGVAAPEARVPIYTERGLPAYFFIYADRNFPDDVEWIPEDNPMIIGLEVYGRTNKTKKLCGYLNDKHEIWQATLRNAHPMADDDPLTEIGGVLISKEDLGSLDREQYSPSDNFDYDLKVFMENESDLPALHYDITLHVCCIYLDKLLLKGSGTNLSFVEAS